jgi:hypothetical protein
VVDLVAGQRDQPVGLGMVGAFCCGERGQKGGGEHRQDGPAVPGGPAADLVLIESDEALAGLKGLVHSPAASGHTDHFVQRAGFERIERR